VLPNNSISASKYFHPISQYKTQWFTQCSQWKHAIKLPFFGVTNDVSGVIAVLGLLLEGPAQIRLTQQTEHTQFPVDLERETVFTMEYYAICAIYPDSTHHRHVYLMCVYIWKTRFLECLLIWNTSTRLYDVSCQMSNRCLEDVFKM